MIVIKKKQLGNRDLKKSSSEMPLKQKKITFFSPSQGAINEPESENITDQTDPEKQNTDENNNTAPPTSTDIINRCPQKIKNARLMLILSGHIVRTEILSS